ncbi:MAG: hypothetical protein MJZ34_07340 [Paludibacteraceae bacterium]|nr:hypothetical protein [Paludibacteraceae bacterium]
MSTFYNNIPIEDLPSKGRLYREDAFFRIKILSIGDIKYLETNNDIDIIYKDILQKNLETNVPIDDILIDDRNYMIVFLKINSFTNSQTEIKTQCPYCGYMNEELHSLDELDIKYIEDTYANDGYKRRINLTYMAVELRYPTIGNYNRVEGEFADIYKYTDIVSDISNMDAYDYMTLQTAVDEFKIGFQEDFLQTCGQCRNDYNVKVVVDYNTLLKGVDIMLVYRNILGICKYCGYQINDDMSYRDYMSYLDIVNKMIEEEKEKEKSNSKNSMESSSFISLKNNIANMKNMIKQS